MLFLDLVLSLTLKVELLEAEDFYIFKFLNIACFFVNLAGGLNCLLEIIKDIDLPLLKI